MKLFPQPVRDVMFNIFRASLCLMAQMMGESVQSVEEIARRARIHAYAQRERLKRLHARKKPP